MATTVNTGNMSRSLMPGVNTWAGLAYNPKEQQHKEIFEQRSSDKNFEVAVTMGPMGLMSVKPEGENIKYSDFGQGFEKFFNHVVYANGFIITREAVEDNQYSELAEYRSKQIGESARETKEIVHANVLNRAFNSSYVGADGLELCSDAHLLEKGGTYRNELATAADLSESALEQAIIDIRDFRDGANKRIKVRARKLVLPSALEFDAKRILHSELQNDTANNAINAIKGSFSEGFCINDYLSDPDAWFILTDCSNGLLTYQRRSFEMGNDSDFDSENMKFKGSERYSLGWVDPRCIFGSPGA